MPRVAEEERRERLLTVVRARRGRLTVGDAVASSGLAVEEATEGLWRLVDEAGGHVEVDERGECLFSFPRPPSIAARGWRALWRTAWATFKAVFKVCIGLVLVVYFAVFAAIMLALAVIGAIVALASLFAGRDDRDGIDLGDVVRSPFTMLALNAIGWWLDRPPAPRPYARFERNRGISGRPETRAEVAPPRRPVVEWVFSYVFGEEESPPDPLMEEQQTIRYARDVQGLITTSDLVALTGGSLDDAARLAARVTMAHNGRVDLTPNASLVYRFEDVLPTAGRIVGGREWSWCWERPRPKMVTNRNTEGVNIGITVLNGFNLLWSGWFLLSFHAANLVLGAIFGAVEGGYEGATLRLLLAWIPFVFSLLFFIVPAVRSFWVDAVNAGREAHNERCRTLQAIFFAHVWTKEAPPMTAAALEGVLPRRVREQRLRECAARFGGREVSKNAFVFDRLRQEQTAVQLARQGTDMARFEIGRTVFATQRQATVSGELRSAT